MKQQAGAIEAGNNSSSKKSNSSNNVDKDKESQQTVESKETGRTRQLRSKKASVSFRFSAINNTLVYWMFQTSTGSEKDSQEFAHIDDEEQSSSSSSSKGSRKSAASPKKKSKAK